jgi:chromosome segregation ATPase
MMQEQTSERLIAAFQGFAEQQQAFNQQITSAVLDLQGFAKRQEIFNQRQEAFNQRQEAFNQRFEQRLDGIDRHLTGIDRHLDSIDQRLDGVEQRLDGVDQDIKGLDHRLGNVEQEVKGLHAKVDGLEEQMNSQFKAVEQDLKGLHTKVDDLTDRVDGLDKKTGRYSTKQGKFYERLIVPNILDKFEKIGYHFDKVDANVEFFEEGKKDCLAEVDIVLENGTQVLLVETKGSLRNSFVNEHLARIQLLRDKGYFPGKAIYGAIAAPFIDFKPCKYAQAHGLFVLCQPDAFPVKIEEFMEGYAPQSW